MAVKHLTMDELEAGLDYIRQSPKDEGVLELIARRPRDDERETLEAGQLDLQSGLEGDNWKTRGSQRTSDGTAHPDMQLTLMNSRTIALMAGGERSLAPGRGPTLRRSGSQRRKPAAWNATNDWRGGDRSQRPAAYRLLKVRRPFWAGCAEVCQFA